VQIVEICVYGLIFILFYYNFGRNYKLKKEKFYGRAEEKVQI